jgi:Lon-like protease
MTTSQSTRSPSSPFPAPLHRRHPRRRRWPYLAGALGILAAFVVAASFISVPYYALAPGEAISVAKLITVPPAQRHPIAGQVLLTDVEVNSLKLIDYLTSELDPDVDVVPRGALTANLPVSEFDDEGTVDMEESQMTAHAVALRQLGYSVPEHDVGVTIYVIDPGSPAWRTLHIGDVITSIDGVPTTTPLQLQSAIRAHHPGDEVSIRVGSITDPTPGHLVSVRLSSTVENHQRVPFLGIGDPSAPINGMGTQPAYDFPFPVSINSDNIGGPSAGLAWTLGIINTISGGHITGGRRIAATGTIRPDGSVGDVGGVKQKTVAVERAGASAFFVPVQELTVARSMATSSLKVYAVTSVRQALTDLAHLGGDLGRAAQGPPAGPGGHSVPSDWQASPWS